MKLLAVWLTVLVSAVICSSCAVIFLYWLKPEFLSISWWKGDIKCVRRCVNRTEFKIYWNLPSIVCAYRHNITFTHVMEEYGITQNENDAFRGDQISILYDPGLFPKVTNFTWPDVNLDDIVLINGGIPQNGNIVEHLNAFQEDINKAVPVTNNQGLIIIDMEHWGATWAQNFNYMEINHLLSKIKVEEKHPDWKSWEIMREAIKEYEGGAKLFLSKTLLWGQFLRPKAKWGYYQYPQCFNPPGVDYCSNATQEDNNKLTWLWSESTALFPSLYLSHQNKTIEERAAQMRGMVREAFRVGEYVGKKTEVYSYIWYRYMDTKEVILDADLENLFRISRDEGAAGVVIWGAYEDFKNKERCLIFADYVTYSLGPIAKKVLEEDPYDF